MRVFHTQVFNENIEGTTALYSDPTHNALMGLVEKLCIFALSDSVGGTTPNLTVQIEESADQVHWINKTSPAEISSATLTSTAVTISVGRDAGANPASGFVRLRVQLGGNANAEGHVRVWVTGRGEQTTQ